MVVIEGLGVEAVREGQSHPHLPPLHSEFPSVCPPKYPLVFLMSHSGDGDGGNQWVWIARAHYMTAGH